MRTRNISIPIPDFLPYARTMKYLWNTLKFKFFPYRCEECGVKMDFNNIDTDYQAPGKLRVLVSFSDCICQNCLAKRVNSYFTYKFKSEPNKKCHCCGELKDTIQGTGLQFGEDDTYNA